MRAMRALRLVLWLVLCLCGCGSRPASTVPTAPWLSEARILVDGFHAQSDDCRAAVCQHNENTDLTTYRGALYLVHRTAQSQILGPNSSLRVYRSDDDGQTFALVTIVPAPSDRDLRDPHFYTVGGALYIKALTRLPVTLARDSQVQTVAVETHTSDGRSFSPLAAIAPTDYSLWRVQQRGGIYYSAAYHDGDDSVVLFTSPDGRSFTRGPVIYDRAEDSPSETELVFLPSGRLLALVRMDGTDKELLGDSGRLRTKVCWAAPPYQQFDCPAELSGQRLDGPLSFSAGPRLFLVARKHLQGTGKKRTALFEISGALDTGPLQIHEHGELPSAGDTAYAGAAALSDGRILLSWYAGDLARDDSWVVGMLGPSDIWLAALDLSRL